LLPLLKHALEAWERRPERAPRQFARPERHKGEPSELSSEGTERRRQRPKRPVTQARHFRGKPKTHSAKNVVVGKAQTKRVGCWSQRYAGTTQDKQSADREALCYPRDALLSKDTGFQGYAPSVRQTRQSQKSRAKGNSRGARHGTLARSRASG
jgi:hypothetical protein